MIAYWHPGEAAGPLYGVKWLSYAPNMASTDIARRRGYHDALLISRDGWVLEGPTFTVAWFVDGVLETPSLDLGILASITRAVLFEIGDAVGIPVVEGRYPLERLLAADEVVGMSTIKEVSPLGTVGDVELSTGPIAGRLHAAFRDIVEAETGG